MSNREQVVRVAEKFVAKGKIDAAIKEYLKVLKENPNDVSTLNRLGDLYARISRIDEAVRLFTQIAEQYTEDGFLVKAIAIYKKIIKLDPTRLQVYENLAGLYHKQGLVNEARTQYQVLGDYYLKHNDAASAINIFQKMAELEPDNPSHHLKLAELFQKGQLWDKALRSYRNIAEMMLQHGRVEEAMRVYQRAIEVHAGDVVFITDAVLGLKDAGHTGPAARLLAIAVAANPEAEKVAKLAGLRQVTAEVEMEMEVEVEPERVTLPPPASPPPPRREDPTATQQLAMPAAPPPAMQPAPPPRLAPAPQTPPAMEEEDVFVLEIDDAPASQVAPPADMDEPGSAWQRPEPPRAQEIGAGQPSGGDEFSFEVPDLEMPAVGPLDAGHAPPAGEYAEIDLEAPEAWGAGLPDAVEPRAGQGWVTPGFDSEDLELPPLEDELAAQPPQPWADEALPWQEQAPPAAAPEAGEQEMDLSALGLEGPGVDELAPRTSSPPMASGFEDVGFELEMEPELADSPFESAPVHPESPAELRAQLGGVPSEQLSYAPPAPEPPRLQDLLAEAEVFAKYGLEEKAHERLDQVLAAEPDHLEALQVLLDLQLKGGDQARLQPTVKRLREIVDRRGAGDVWERVQAKLTRAGIQVDGGVGAPPPRPASEERVSQLLKSLVVEPAAPAPPRPAAPKKRSIDDALAELTSGVRQAARPVRPATAPMAVPAPAAPPPVAPAPAPAPPLETTRPAAAAGPPAAAAPSISVPPPAAPPIAPPPPAFAASPAAEPVPAMAAPPAAPPAPAAPAPVHPSLDDFDEELPDIVFPEERRSAAVELDDSSMDWLRDAPSSAAAGAAREEKLFDEEDEFFDLAAELEEELGVEEGKFRGEIVHAEEPSLEEIVEGFKKGVAENLSAEDYDTHYNLGIAYREMGLLDEAVGEFQLAAKDPAHLVDCCAMLGLSFLEKGLPELAVKWYQRGLTAPDLKEEVMLSLLYDMGNVYMTMGDGAAAKKTFVELYGINSHYRDVVAKLEDLNR
jgi:pilus assembly protein FimV